MAIARTVCSRATIRGAQVETLWWKTEEASTLIRLGVLAAAIIAVALLNFIPFVGWVANYALVLLGIGAMTRALFLRLMGDTGAALDIDMQPIEA